MNLKLFVGKRSRVINFVQKIDNVNKMNMKIFGIDHYLNMLRDEIRYSSTKLESKFLYSTHLLIILRFQF